MVLFIALGAVTTGFASLGLFFNGEMSRAIVDENYGIAYIAEDVIEFSRERAFDLSVPLAAIATVQP